LISVVIPVYNAAETLEPCLGALESQTLARGQYEVIVVDDGSADATAEIARGHESVVLLSQPHKGAAAARNLGTSHARGTIVLFTDADCVPSPDWIEAMAAAFSDDEVTGVGGAIRTQQRGLVPRFIQLEFDDRYDKMAKHPSIDFICTATGGFRRDVFLESRGFREDLLGAEDTELSFRLASAGHKMVFVPQAIVYHSHPQSLLEYARRKCTYAYWRLMVYLGHPRKVIVDSRTPQTQKVQIGLLFLLAVAALGAIFWRGIIWLAGGLLALFLLMALPFWWKSVRRDRVVGAFLPLFLLVGTTSVAAGLAAGAVRYGIQRMIQRSGAGGQAASPDL